MKSCRAICHRYCAAKERDLPEQIAEIERNDKKTNPQRVDYRDPSSNLVPFDPSSNQGTGWLTLCMKSQLNYLFADPELDPRVWM